MATVASSSAQKKPSNSAAESHRDLLKQIRSHEIALSELSSLSSSRILSHKCSEVAIIILWLDRRLCTRETGIFFSAQLLRKQQLQNRNNWILPKSSCSS